MSITTRLLPDSSDDSGGLLDPFGPFGTSWQGLRDSNDSSGAAAQLSTFEPAKDVQGTYDNLPVGVGRVNSAQMGARAWTDIAASCAFSAETDIGVGRISVSPVADVPTTYLSASFTTYTTKPQADALGWRVRMDFIAHAGVQAFVSEVWLDVDWDPGISGLKGLLFSLLGPLVAVGLHEMPRLAREIERRARTRIPADMYLQAWREMREDPGRAYFVL